MSIQVFFNRHTNVDTGVMRYQSNDTASPINYRNSTWGTINSGTSSTNPTESINKRIKIGYYSETDYSSSFSDYIRSRSAAGQYPTNPNVFTAMYVQDYIFTSGTPSLNYTLAGSTITVHHTSAWQDMCGRYNFLGTVSFTGTTGSTAIFLGFRKNGGNMGYGDEVGNVWLFKEVYTLPIAPQRDYVVSVHSGLGPVNTLYNNYTYRTQYSDKYHCLDLTFAYPVAYAADYYKYLIEKPLTEPILLDLGVPVGHSLRHTFIVTLDTPVDRVSVSRPNEYLEVLNVKYREVV